MVVDPLTRAAHPNFNSQNSGDQGPSAFPTHPSFSWPGGKPLLSSDRVLTRYGWCAGRSRGPSKPGSRSSLPSDAVSATKQNTSSGATDHGSEVTGQPEAVLDTDGVSRTYVRSTARVGQVRDLVDG